MNQPQLSDYVGLLKHVNQDVVGVGVTAFNRIGPALFYPNYQIICYKDSDEVSVLAHQTQIVSVQKDLAHFGDVSRLNSLAILEHPGVQEYLKKLNNPWLFVYRTTPRIDNLCDQLNLKLLANRSEIRDVYEDKKEFFQIGRKIGLPMIPGEQHQLSTLSESSYSDLVSRLGPQMVFQLTDYTRGGGAGTVFVFNHDDYRHLLSDLTKRQAQKTLTHTNVTKFIKGVSGSITGCVTKHGILSGVVQTQIVDMEGLPKDMTKNGVFQGHDWSYGQYHPQIQTKAERIVNTLGKHMSEHGYKGIFGIDLIIDINQNEVYPVECNPRYTGAFPVYTMLQMDSGEIPIDVFQLMEFLGVEYDLNVDQINHSWKTPKHGAHIVLSNPFTDKWAKVVSAPRAGRYILDQGQIVRQGDGVWLSDIQSDQEWILTDGVPLPGQMVKPGLRLGKLMFKKAVLETDKSLNHWSRQVIEAVYRAYQLEPVGE